MKGYTFYICFGKYGGFNFEFNKRTKRICLGFISIALINKDIERLLYNLIIKIQER